MGNNTIDIIKSLENLTIMKLFTKIDSIDSNSFLTKHKNIMHMLSFACPFLGLDRRKPDKRVTKHINDFQFFSVICNSVSLTQITEKSPHSIPRIYIR